MPGFVPAGALAASSAKAAFTTAGTILSAVGQIQQGQAAAAQAAFQARVAEQQAAFERQRAARREAQFRRDAARLGGKQRALLAKAGVKVFEGSPLLLQEKTAAEAEFEALTLRAGGDITSARLRQEAILQRMRGQSSRTAGFIGAGKSLLSGASSIAERLES